MSEGYHSHQCDAQWSTNQGMLANGLLLACEACTEIESMRSETDLAT
jgi:hypothetical protein